jgi:hypothetical protein
MQIGLGLWLETPRAGPPTSAGALLEPADTIAGAGNVAVPGTGALTEPADALAGAGIASGSGGFTEPADTIAGAGSAGSAGGGSGSLTEAADTMAGSGNVSVPGSGSLTEAADTMAGSGNVAVSGSGSLTEASDTLSGFETPAGAPPGTTLTWTSTSSDNTPNFRATFSATPDAGDILNIRVNSGSTNTESLDAGQITTAEVDFELTNNGAGLADGSYFVECWLTRGGTDGGIGSVTATISTGTNSGALTEASDTIAGAGNVAVTGTGALTDTPDTIAGSGSGAPGIAGITSGQLLFLPRQGNPAGVPFGLPLTLDQAA